MDIKTNGSTGGLNPYVHQTNKQPDKADTPQTTPPPAQVKKDAVTLSAHAKEISRAQQALNEVPDVNQERVNELKNQVENGTYQMDPGRIASALLNDLLMNQIDSE
ncbi:MAG: flagellar biosynthesis anti-sigma factor FlgM [Desulfobacterales bacterium]|jgi:negative regulator of flagellin synthesis FlgM